MLVDVVLDELGDHRILGLLTPVHDGEGDGCACSDGVAEIAEPDVDERSDDNHNRDEREKESGCAVLQSFFCSTGFNPCPMCYRSEGTG